MFILVDIIHKINSINNGKTTFLLIVYCISGTLLASQFFWQTFGSLPLLNLTKLKLWISLVLLFVMMLTSSLLALMYVSVPTVIIMRNLTTLLK